jgi:hypothetical protein
MIDEVYLQQCPCLRAFDSWSVCGIRRTRRRTNKNEGTQEFTQVQPPEGKDLRPACLTSIAVVLQRGVYNGGVD